MTLELMPIFGTWMAELGTLVKLFASRSQGEIRRGKTSFLVGGSGNGVKRSVKSDGVGMSLEREGERSGKGRETLGIVWVG
jgi:hypothetical protein